MFQALKLKLDYGSSGCRVSFAVKLLVNVEDMMLGY
jgi:hypothetical protein